MMRRLMMTGSALTLLLAGALAVGGHRVVPAQAAAGVGQACAVNGDYGFASHGACVSYFETMTGSGYPHSSAYIASYCSLFTYPGYVYDPNANTFVYLTNHGQCVKYANEHYKP